eukprot:CAMPEP_0185039744 /NCGR_PEP_ID=MMETSP1103-20130426/36952_1 /TAXON_ID=36769 /ORGANISM="Paraphysomonas bandaiensis, Strain Caron Lab Isolate" /LENGTH=856 /DNA_ID=CAMNT_0027578767 /DNA_START=222 /DNA_END=2792 /DNA_ORIENTATION=+
MNRPSCNSAVNILAVGLGLFFVTFHIVFMIATLFTRWGVDLLKHSLGWRLCIITAASWVTVLFIVSKKQVQHWSMTTFERGALASAVNILGLTVFHHTGLTQAEIWVFAIAMVIPWIQLKHNLENVGYFFNLIWIVPMIITLFGVVMQEAEYTRYFEFLKNSAVERRSIGGENFRDIVSTIDAVVSMICKLEFDVRDRIKNSLMASVGRKKLKGNARRGQPFDDNTIKSHHAGSVYQIETLCTAISVALLADEKKLFAKPAKERFYLSGVCEILFQAFEDSVFPRMVPLFYDRSVGDIAFYDMSKKLLDTIMFLILFDAVSGESPGFCNVSFEQRDSYLSLIITKVVATSGVVRRGVGLSSTQISSVGESAEAEDESVISQLLPVQNTGDGNAPQVWLADRVVRLYLKSRIVAFGPEKKAGLSIYSWSLDLSAQSFRRTTDHVDVSDIYDCSFTWKIIEKLDHDDVDASGFHVSRYDKFLLELDVLKVSYVVHHLGQYHRDEAYLDKCKVGVIHEDVLLVLNDDELEQLLSGVVDLIILSAKEVKNYEASFFFSKFPVSLSRKEWSTDFRKALRMRVSADIPAAEFIEVFKNIRRSNRYDLQTTEVEPARPTYTSSSVNSESARGALKKTMPRWYGPGLANKLYPDIPTGKTDTEHNSFAQSWRESISGWHNGARGFPQFLRILGNDKNNDDDLDLTPKQKKLLGFIKQSLEVLKKSSCVKFQLIEKVKAHALEGAVNSNSRALYLYLNHYYVRPITKLRTYIDMFVQHQSSFNREPLVSEVRATIKHLVERTAYDDFDFLNMWFQCVLALISEEFDSFLYEIIKLVVPGMLDIAETAIWGIPEVVEVSWLNLWDE